jgi:Flp pilus assembly protein TadG
MNRPRRLAHLPRDRRGVAALELALALPVLLLILTGFYETYIYIRSVATMERTAFTLADLIARRNLVCDASSTSDPNSLATYLTTAAPLISQPLDLDDNGEVIVSAVVYSATLGAEVSWQKTGAHTLAGVSSLVGSTGGKATLAGGIAPDTGGDTVIVAEVYYSYDWFPLLRAVWSGAPEQTTLRRVAYYRARLSSLATLYTAATNSNCPS